MPNANDNVCDWQPLVDIRETKGAYRIDVELPAVDPQNVRIELNGTVLRVSGERRADNDEESVRVRCRERSYGKFVRGFQLPEGTDANAISATAKDGVVSIAVGKLARAQARTIPVAAA